MTQSSFSYVNLGQANLDGDIQALFRDVFQPGVLSTFDEKRVVAHLVRHKQLTKGKAAEFQLYGGVTAKYKAKAYEIETQNVAKAKKVINVDPWLYTAVMLDELEAKMSDVEDRAELIKAMGQALANKEDRQLLQVGVLAARSSSLITGENRSGSVIYAGSDVETDASKLLEAIFLAGVEMDEKNVPEDERYLFLRPRQYSVLVQSKLIIDKNTGAGSLPKGVTGTIDNFNIVKTTHLPSTNITYSGEEVTPNNTYHGDFANTVALALQKEALATVDFIGLMTDVSWQEKEFSHLISTRVAQGHGFLRPECAVEISKASAGTSGSGT